MEHFKKIIDGKKYSEEFLQKLHPLSTEFFKNFNRKPCLAVILVGDNTASSIYVKNKVRTAKKNGIRSVEVILSRNVSEEDLLNEIFKLNDDQNVDGILVQLPLPIHISERKIINNISPIKDVDGFHPTNFGKLFMGDPNFIPCTPLGCFYMLKNELKELSGKNAVIIGRSNIVGKPMASLLLSSNCSVTITHSKTENLREHCKKADILISAVGIPEMVDDTYVKQDVIIIDVGINRLQFVNSESNANETKLVGDVNFRKVINIAKKITPVPGGVGPMTIACLMHNTVKAAYNNKKQNFDNILGEIF